MVPFSLVYFEGKWSEEEAALIEAAAEGAEQALYSGGTPCVEAPWVAVAHDAGPSGLYVASRQGNVEVMAAESPEALADKIRGAEAVVGRGHVQGTRR
jgi:hypothetical protein